MKAAHSFSFAQLNRSNELSGPAANIEQIPLATVKEAPGKVTFVFTLMETLIEELGSKISRTHPHIAGEQLASRICPVTLENGDWAILVTPDYKQSDGLSEVVNAVQKNAGNDDIQILSVTSSLLLTVRDAENIRSVKTQTKEQANAYLASFYEFIAWGIRNNASDVHMNVEDREAISQVHFTIDGQYIAPPTHQIPTMQLREILNVAWQKSHGGSGPVFSGTVEQQCRIETIVDQEHVMGRWASLATDRGPSVTLRLLKTELSLITQSLAEQGFLPSQVAAFERALLSDGGGLILSGIVGSGKSTTLATLLSMLPSTHKIITLEDPVEFRIRNALQNTITRTLDGQDHSAFHSKLATIKRSAPHDLMIGEIRDTQTAGAFHDMAGSGTRVYSTVHAKSAMQIPERLWSASLGIPSDFLASPGMLNLLVFQALIPRLCDCAMPIETLIQTGGLDGRGAPRDGKFWSDYLLRFDRLYRVGHSGVKIRNPEGCTKCRKKDIPQLNGYNGRTVVSELIEPNADRHILHCISAKDTLGLQLHLDKAEKTAMDDNDMTNKTIMECAVYKVINGIFDPRDVEARTQSFETVELIRSQKGYKS